MPRGRKRTTTRRRNSKTTQRTSTKRKTTTSNLKLNKKESLLKSLPQQFRSLRISLKRPRLPRAVVIGMIIALAILIIDGLIQLYFMTKVVAYSPKGVVVTKSEVVNRFFEEQTPTTVTLITQRLLSEKILEREAKLNGVVVTDEEITTELQKIAQQYGMDIQTLMATTGTDEKQLKEGLRYRLMLQKLVPINYTPSEDEIKQFYETNKDVLFADKTLDEARELVIAYLQENYAQQEYGNWILTKLNEYNVKDLTKDVITYKPIAGLNYFGPIIINSTLDTTLRVPMIKFDLPASVKNSIDKVF